MYNRRQFIRTGSLGGIGLVMGCSSSPNCSLPTVTQEVYNEIATYQADDMNREVQNAVDTLRKNDRNLAILVEESRNSMQAATPTNAAFTGAALVYLALEEECKYGQSTNSDFPIVSDDVARRIVGYSQDGTLLDRLNLARDNLVNRDKRLLDLISLYVNGINDTPQATFNSGVGFVYMALLKSKSLEVQTPTKSPSPNEIQQTA